MMNSEKAMEALSFRDGDNVLLTHFNRGRRVWANGREAFSRVCMYDGHVEFRQLTDDGVDIAETAEVERTYRFDYFRALGDVAYNRAVLFEDAEDWVWHANGVPYPDMLNTFRQASLVPRGGNDFSLGVRESDGQNGEFRVSTIMDSLVDKTLPIAAEPGYFFHDMDDHGVGMGAIDQRCMQSLRSLAIFSQDLSKNHRPASQEVAVSVAQWLDYYSYFKFYVRYMAKGYKDPLLTDIVRNSWKGLDAKHAMHIEKMVKDSGFSINKNKKVIRSPETIQYYKEAIEVLDPRA